MNRRLAILAAGVVALLAIALGVWLMMHGSSLAVLNPQGVVAVKERNLMVTASALMLLIVVPVWVLAFGIAWRYRATNTKARYEPAWNSNRLLEGLWWGIPCVIIVVLGVLTWTSSHELDPYRPLASNQAPLTVQVVALQWKWLFIYPDQHMASVNYLELPTGRPVHFVITADAPMNSFWIPQLGGQIYAMPGMSTQLNLQADAEGNYRGSSANLSGDGFAGMNFMTHAVAPAEFEVWTKQVLAAGHSLDAVAYAQLAKPSQNQPATTFAPVDPGLYDGIVNTYLSPTATGHHKEMP